MKTLDWIWVGSTALVLNAIMLTAFAKLIDSTVVPTADSKSPVIRDSVCDRMQDAGAPQRTCPERCPHEEALLKVRNALAVAEHALAGESG